jgi:nucleotide-binding universal stress UspA family protein
MSIGSPRIDASHLRAFERTVDRKAALMALHDPIILCVDGSEDSVRAASTGYALLPRAARAVVVTVVEESDPTLVTGGGGHAGGVMSGEEFDRLEVTRASDGRSIVEQAAAAIDAAEPEVRVISGDPGRALCELATEISAQALVLGTRGRGGIKRALLGSVSDYVVRNAPCPVVITAVNS